MTVHTSPSPGIFGLSLRREIIEYCADILTNVIARTVNERVLSDVLPDSREIERACAVASGKLDPTVTKQVRGANAKQ